MQPVPHPLNSAAPAFGANLASDAIHEFPVSMSSERPRRRHYRESLARHGQVSPLFIPDLVQPHLVGRTFADVGCGAGVPVSVLRARWPWSPPFINEHITDPIFVGVDFSPRAVAYASAHGAYDRVLLSESASLPLGEREVDVAMSLENLEHLYPDEVNAALSELVRIARRRIIITTPWPWDVVNTRWLADEIEQARSDVDPMDQAEFLALAGAVHKSTLLPEQLIDAGFKCASFSPSGVPTTHPVYVGDTDQLDLSKIGSVLGIERTDVSASDRDLRDAYAGLLAASLELRHRTPRFKRSWYPRLALNLVRKAVARSH